MKKLVLKSVALAVGALVSSASFAQVNLDATAANIVPLKYVSEQTVGAAPAGTALRHGAAANQTATTAFGASLGTDVTAYVRVDVAGGTFNAAVGIAAFAVNGSNGAATVSIAQGGAANSSFVIFAVTPVATGNLVGANTATIDTDTVAQPGVSGVRVLNQNGVTLRYRLYETLTAAATEGSALKDTTARPYINFASALNATVATNTATADVGSVPSYSQFTAGGATGQAVGAATFVVDATIALASGAGATPGDLLDATNAVSVAGDFSFARNTDNTYTGGALTRVVLRRGATAFDCSTGTAVNASTLSATAATFTGITAANLAAADPGTRHILCLAPATTSTNEILISSYSASVTYAMLTGFTESNVAGAAFGNVARNGVRMVAPLIQLPAGWTSRLVLTNTGTTARTYSVTYVTEAGVTVTATGAGASGSLAASSTTVVDLGTVLSFVGPANRGSLVVTVNAPQSQIDGLYQIVNAASGSISNHILSYKN